MNFWWCSSSILDSSILVYGGRRSPCWPRWRLIWYGMVACFHHMVGHGQSTTWQSPSFSRLSMWLLSSSWNPSAHLALFFLLWRYPPSDAVLTTAILPLSRRLVGGGSILFLPVQVQKTCPLPQSLCRSHNYAKFKRPHYNSVQEKGNTKGFFSSNEEKYQLSPFNMCVCVWGGGGVIYSWSTCCNQQS